MLKNNTDNKLVLKLTKMLFCFCSRISVSKHVFLLNCFFCVCYNLVNLKNTIVKDNDLVVCTVNGNMKSVPGVKVIELTSRFDHTGTLFSYKHVMKMF